MTEERWQISKVWLRSIFLEDWLTKTIALTITLILWYGITGNRTPTTRLIRNVHFVTQLPENTEASNEIMNSVDITVTGDKARVTRLSAEELSVVADLTNSKPGEFVVQLKPETVNIELPNGIKIDEIEPSKISIKLESRIEKEVKVKPAFVGQLPAGLEIYETTIVPAVVRVRGAESHVNALDGVATEKIDLNIHTGDFNEKQVTVSLFDQKITVLDAVVDVYVNVGETRIQKTFENVAVRDSGDAKVNPDKAAVTLYGARSVLENLRTEDISIFLDVSADGTISSRVALPDNLAAAIETRSIRPSVFVINN